MFVGLPYQIIEVFLLRVVGVKICNALAKGSAFIAKGSTCSLCGSMIDDLVDDGPNFFRRICPVVGSLVIVFFLKRILFFVFVVVCDLSCASR